eukprot:2292882-Rhodomonas_salina.1
MVLPAHSTDVAYGATADVAYRSVRCYTRAQYCYPLTVLTSCIVLPRVPTALTFCMVQSFYLHGSYYTTDLAYVPTDDRAHVVYLHVAATARLTYHTTDLAYVPTDDRAYRATSFICTSQLLHDARTQFAAIPSEEGLDMDKIRCTLRQ